MSMPCVSLNQQLSVRQPLAAYLHWWPDVQSRSRHAGPLGQDLDLALCLSTSCSAGVSRVPWLYSQLPVSPTKKSMSVTIKHVLIDSNNSTEERHIKSHASLHSGNRAEVTVPLTFSHEMKVIAELSTRLETFCKPLLRVGIESR